MALAIIKVLLRKSFLIKLFISTLKLHKIIYKADTIRNEIMSFISNSFSNLTPVSVINYDDEQRVESP